MPVDTTRRQATIAGVSMKHISLVTLTLQNSALILIMHYSRIMPPVNGRRYYTSTAVLMNEVLKLAISITMALYEIASSPKTPDTSTALYLLNVLARAVFTGDSWKLAIPAVLYTLQNTLQYVAVSNLDAATFQVTYQLKILTTALFSVTLLGRSLSLWRWLSLVLLMAGVAIVQIPSAAPKAALTAKSDLEDRALHLLRSIWEKPGSVTMGPLFDRSATYEGIDEDVLGLKAVLNPSVGFAAVIVACMISGLAGVYFEKILKDPRGEAREVSVWIRNVQLSFYSLWPALLVGVLFKDGEDIARTGFFTGYNWIVWLAITFQAFGGVIVALVVNYADNIAKNFATSISIIISFLASYVVGTGVVLAATYMYTTAAGEKKATPLPVSNPVVRE